MPNDGSAPGRAPRPKRAAPGDDDALEQAVRILRRRRLVVLQALILVPLIALALSLAQDEQYTATSTLLFREAPQGLLGEAGDSGFVDPSREAATNDELVGLPVVAERAAERLDGVTGEQVLASVSVDSGGEADIAEISATTDSPELAARMADSYARAYIEFRREADRAQIQQAIDLVEASIAALSPADAAGEQGQVLQGRLDQLELTQALQTGRAELVQTADPPASPSSPKTRRNVALGVILGGLLGFGLAALLERIDRRVRTVDELEELFDAPILTRVPRSRSLARHAVSPSDMAQTPEGEAFRVLRTNLRYFDVDRRLGSLLVASPAPGDGKSTIARYLAMTMAEMGDNVVLVEADLHKGPAARNVVERPHEGLSSVLVGMPLENALEEVEIGSAGSGGDRTLSVLPSGPMPPNPTELLESDRMRAVLAELQEMYDIVVVDSPALGIVGDALALVPAVSAVLAVSGLEQTTRDSARDFVKQLRLTGTHPVGVVANFAEVDRGAHSYYYRSRAAGRG